MQKVVASCFVCPGLMVRLSFNLTFKKDKLRTQEIHITAAIIINLVTIIMAYSSYVKNCQIEILI